MRYSSFKKSITRHSSSDILHVFHFLSFSFFLLNVNTPEMNPIFFCSVRTLKYSITLQNTIVLRFQHASVKSQYGNEKKKKVGLIVIHLSFYFSLDKTCMLEIFFHLPKALKWIKFVSKANFYQQSITEDTQGDRHFTVSPKLTPKKSYTTFSLYFFFF